MIAVIDYSVGNPGSILNMLRKIGAKAELSADEKVLSRANKLILPGVGAFDTGMANLRVKNLIPLLDELVMKKEIPILGICLGMQLLGKGSEEGIAEGLGWLNFTSVRFKFVESDKKLKVPHMGWNNIFVRRSSLLLKELSVDSRYYFVHSYYAHPNEPQIILAETSYGINFASVLQKNNIFGVQFHPEKSHRFGLQLLRNFAECC
ncbi:imidazole glycerol phosphate synthase subunit HisH [Anaeroselena agilis]|uniref:Imidazole glycerol phosphate synthase subunit HisH n=1 Tax=Anaeroselena agilis TaxID=3063788 RepID=A0ABU3P478_9FIRM|nr:imidazole glycerol phosphate synthase subunit HisH [Selenomonadales bacterium 4137-cl]